MDGWSRYLVYTKFLPLSSLIYGLDFHLEEEIHRDGCPARLSLKKSTSVDESNNRCKTQKNVKRHQKKKVVDPKH